VQAWDVRQRRGADRRLGIGEQEGVRIEADGPTELIDELQPQSPRIAHGLTDPHDTLG